MKGGKGQWEDVDDYDKPHVCYYCDRLKRGFKIKKWVMRKKP